MSVGKQNLSNLIEDIDRAYRVALRLK